MEEQNWMKARPWVRCPCDKHLRLIISHIFCPIPGRKIIQRFPLHMESRLQDLRHKWIKFWKIEPPGHVSMPWSILTTPFLETCRKTIKTVVTVWNGLLRQPLDHVAGKNCIHGTE